MKTYYIWIIFLVLIVAISLYAMLKMTDPYNAVGQEVVGASIFALLLSLIFKKKLA